MSVEVLNFVADNPSLPVDGDLRSSLISHTGLLYWAQPDPDHCTIVSDRISTYQNLKSPADLLLAPGSDSTYRAAIAEDASLDNWESAAFDGVNDTYLWQGAVPDFSGAYFVAALVNTGVTAGVHGIFGRPASGATQSSMYQTGTTYQVSHRGATVNLKTGVAAGVWDLLIWSGSGTTLRGALNGGAAALGGSASGTITTAAPNFGSLLNTSGFYSGKIADLFVGNVDILDPADTSGLRDLILRYCRGVYGQALA